MVPETSILSSEVFDFSDHNDPCLLIPSGKSSTLTYSEGAWDTLHNNLALEY